MTTVANHHFEQRTTHHHQQLTTSASPPDGVNCIRTTETVTTISGSLQEQSEAVIED